MQVRLWILNNDNNKNDALHYAAVEGAWGSKVRSEERNSLSHEIAYFPRVWANVKSVNWLVNKKYLTSVKGKHTLGERVNVKVL